MKRTPTMVKALNDIDTALEVSMATVVTAETAQRTKEFHGF